ncbi:MAG: hypothetical protein AB1716_02160 [Planctomycetota bacterium]
MRTQKSVLMIGALLVLPVAWLIAAQQPQVEQPPPVATQDQTVAPPGGEPDCWFGVVPPGGTWGTQLTYGEWAAKWIQWATSIPKDRNPLLDLTGEFAAEGQAGPVWFLAGTMGGTGFVRECTVPRGKALFFPLLNYWFFNCRNEHYTVQEMRAVLSGLIDQACVLELTVDGRPVEDLYDFRVASPAFGIDVPENNIHVDFCSQGMSPAGEYAPVVTEGFYYMLRPFWFGRHHEIYMHGAICDPVTHEIIFESEVTYRLTLE